MHVIGALCYVRGQQFHSHWRTAKKKVWSENASKAHAHGVLNGKMRPETACGYRLPYLVHVISYGVNTEVLRTGGGALYRVSCVKGGGYERTHADTAAVE